MRGRWLIGWVDCQVGEQEGRQVGGWLGREEGRRVGREEGRMVSRPVRVGWWMGRGSAGGGQEDGRG